MAGSDFVSTARALDRHIADVVHESRLYLAEAQSTLTRQLPPPIPNQPSLTNHRIDRPVARTDEVSRGHIHGVRRPLSPSPRQGEAPYVQLPSIRGLLDERAYHNTQPVPAPGASAIHQILRIHTIDTWLDDIPDRTDSVLPPQQQGQKRTFGDMVDDWKVRRDPKGPRLGPVSKEENPEGEMTQYLFGSGVKRRGERGDGVWRSSTLSYRRTAALLTEPMAESWAKF